jgi:hypothetical protein
VPPGFSCPKTAVEREQTQTLRNNADIAGNAENRV